MLYIHGIHTSALRLRQPAFHQVIQTVRLAAQKAGFEVVPRLVLSPNSQDIQGALKNYEGRIDYAKPAFTNADAKPAAADASATTILDSIHTLNLQEISNLEKHRKAWAFAASAAAGSLHVVLEDDVTLLGGAMSAMSLQEALEFARTAGGGLTPLCTVARPLWLSKEAYVITPQVATSLLADTQKIKFNARGALSWWAAQHPANVAYLPQRITLDGSKLGLCPSAIHTHNPLIFNKEYTEMLELAATPGKCDAASLAKYEASLGKTATPSPDYLHLLGILYHRAGNYARARDMFVTAIRELGRQGGVLSTNSELLMNALSVHKHLQSDLAEAVQQPSKYVKMSPAPLTC